VQVYHRVAGNGAPPHGAVGAQGKGNEFLHNLSIKMKIDKFVDKD
jgi:hypothetical protein